MTVVVAFVSRKGGVGKSTLARALAAIAVRRGLSTTLADLDTDQHTSMRWHRLRERQGVVPRLVVRPYRDVDAAITGEQDADLLIMDAPGHAPVETREITSVAHMVIQPTNACFDDLQPAVDLFYKLAASGIPKSRLSIALSRMHDIAEEAAARAYIKVADFEVLPGATTERPGYRDAHNRGLAFIENSNEDMQGPAFLLLCAILSRVEGKLVNLGKGFTAPRYMTRSAVRSGRAVTRKTLASDGSSDPARRHPLSKQND